jgi:glycosyltransferase involved in cell wall biosynthesis
LRILWVVNIVLPQVAHLVDGRKFATGGWINAMIQQIARVPGVELGVAMRAPVSSIVTETIDGIRYFLIPSKSGKAFDISEADCRKVLEDFAPDLLHVEGTEFSHARTFLSTWQGPNVVSLQGIINGYEPYQYGGLPVGEMLFSGKLVPTLAAASLIYRKLALFKPRLKDEIETIRMAKNLLGRTTWDRAHAYAINPAAPYYSCNRILRDSFYGPRWNPREMERHTLFIGNSTVPLKGAHFVLQAVAQLKREYPDIKIYIAGEDPYPKGGSRLKKMVSYPAYLRYLVETLGLTSHVEFTGLLQADAMAERLRRTHCYVLCSTIENSPNTLGEAMILGVPCVAAFTGGAPDMASDGVEALYYRDNDPQLLAYQIRRIFEDESLANGLSERARVRARITHDPVANMNNTLAAYEKIMNVSLRSKVAAQ